MLEGFLKQRENEALSPAIPGDVATIGRRGLRDFASSRALRPEILNRPVRGGDEISAALVADGSIQYGQ